MQASGGGAVAAGRPALALELSPSAMERGRGEEQVGGAEALLGEQEKSRGGQPRLSTIVSGCADESQGSGLAPGAAAGSPPSAAAAAAASLGAIPSAASAAGALSSRGVSVQALGSYGSSSSSGSSSAGSATDEHSDAEDVIEVAAGLALQSRKRPIMRLLDRDASSFQSQGNFNVKHTNQSAVLFWGDIYHVIIHLPLWGLLLLFVMVYVVSFLVFAAFWYMIPDSCGTGLETFVEAFYLSVETQMTIGYGVPDPGFRNCNHVLPVLLAQSLTGLVIDAMMIGVIFQHVSCANTRASTVIFSSTAVLQVIDGCVHLVFRVAEMQKQPLLQAVMQVYCVQHHSDESMPGGVRVEVAAMQLKEPDTDMYNGVLFLGLPTMVVHKVDYSSPLAPSRPVPVGANQPPPTPAGGWSDYPSPREVKEHLRERPYLEVLVLLSGTEDATASSIEARHSYTLEDMVWNRAFQPCVSIDAHGVHCINFASIHKTCPTTGELQTQRPQVSATNSTGDGPKLTYSRRCLAATYEEEEGHDGNQNSDFESVQRAHGSVSSKIFGRGRSSSGGDWMQSLGRRSKSASKI